MTPTPVGMRCPECASQRTKVVRGVGQQEGFAQSPATYVLIGLNVIVFLIEIATGTGGLSGGGLSRFMIDFGLYGPFVAEGELYRLVTSGFLHADLVLYFASLLAGSFGALLVEPDAVTVGASGAVYGLAGAVFIMARGRGMEALAGQIGFLIVFNLIFSFVAPRISVGGHIGGLIGGGLCALLIVAGERGMLGRNRLPLELLAMVAVGAASVVGALAVV
jgi:membrane associated rhomboid family serine protease